MYMEKIITGLMLGMQVVAIMKEEAAIAIIQWGQRKDRADAIEAADVHVVTRAMHACLLS